MKGLGSLGLALEIAFPLTRNRMVRDGANGWPTCGSSHSTTSPARARAASAVFQGPAPSWSSSLSPIQTLSDPLLEGPLEVFCRFGCANESYRDLWVSSAWVRHRTDAGRVGTAFCAQRATGEGSNATIHSDERSQPGHTQHSKVKFRLKEEPWCHRAL